LDKSFQSFVSGFIVQRLILKTEKLQGS